MKIRKDSSAFKSRRKKDIVLGSKDKCQVFNVELEEGESIQLLVPMSDGRTCVHLEVINGMLGITGGASIIDSIEVDGYSRTAGYSPDPKPEPFSSLRFITELDEGDPDAIRQLQEQGIVNAGNLAGCTFYFVEATCGLNFATRAAEWLKTLGLSMRQ